MKTRNLLMLLFMGVAASSTFAQKKVYTNEKWSDNIFISATGGTSLTYTGESTKFGKFAPHVTLSLGKWINPVWGFRGQAGAWTANYDCQGLSKCGKGKTLNQDKHVGVLRLDGLFNISNAICGYNPDRLFTLSAFAGPGLQVSKVAETAGAEANVKIFPNASLGLLGKFNVSQNFDIDLEARGELAARYLGYEAPSHRIGGIYLGAGLTYTFGGKFFTPFVATSELDALNSQINNIRKDYEQAQADLAAANEKIANFKPEVKEVVKTETLVGPRAIFFRINSARIDDYGKVNIKLVADIIKANPEKKYQVSGYADKATGTPSYNQKLSDKRAKAVYDLLVKEGVNPSQLEIVAHGGTADMFFNKNKLNRVVILGQ